MRSYSLDNLGDLDWVTNLPTVIERIDLAATKAAVLMRALGMTLPGRGVPSLDHLDTHLRQLVAAAIDDLCLGGNGQRDEGGFAESLFFEVYTEMDTHTNVDVSILFKLA